MLNTLESVTYYNKPVSFTVDYMVVVDISIKSQVLGFWEHNPQ